ncbi:serine/threonine protein kinase [Luteolibacter sp. GHJ8]|uniref:non-specific serine/threonine protein kinase n=1 Tax=Luteolibacter rhizosphaerae TaxID=2989719 RepID=A0ABT3G0K4_9BACT|nr:serine/threonine-protein kinase [Luteolibacter rhizosphaerae]MCW1913363.1 serine/threonine protein kinase [Luteolibacter rhizosphaerae]
MASSPLHFESFEVLQNDQGEPWVLGQGSFGTTYKVRHRSLDRVCALKVIRDDAVRGKGQGAERETARFIGEVKALAKMQHHGIAVVFEYQDRPDEGYFYYAMEFCKGGNLEELVAREGPLSWPVARWILLQVAEALAYAHERGMLHRDIKPANLVLAEPWPEQQVKLIDFGILQPPQGAVEGSKLSLSHGSHGVFNDTTASPEQLLSVKLDARSDLYSLGITLWWLLIGANPFAKQPRAQVIAERLRSDYANEFPADLDPEAREILLGLLAKRPEDRFPDARTLVGRITDGVLQTSSQVAASAAQVTGSPATYDETYSIPNPGSDLIVKMAQAAIYRAKHMASGETVAAITAEAGMSPETREGFRAAAAAREDFGCYRMLDWCSSANEDYFIATLPSGQSLLDLLRKFGAARAQDAFPLLTVLAKSFDASVARTTRGIRLELADIRVSSHGGESGMAAFSSWADVDPGSATSLPSFQTDGDQDAAGTLDISTAGPANPAARFAALIYRLISGGSPPYASYFTTSGYVMVSGLSEAGNHMLAKVLAGGDPDLLVSTLVERLSKLEIQPRRAPKQEPAAAPVPVAVAEVPPLPVSAPEIPAAPPPALPVVAPPRPPRKAWPVWVLPAAIAGVACLVVLGLMISAAKDRKDATARFEAQRLKTEQESAAQLKALQERLETDAKKAAELAAKTPEKTTPPPAPEPPRPKVDPVPVVTPSRSARHVLASRNALIPAKGTTRTVKSQSQITSVRTNLMFNGQKLEGAFFRRVRNEERWDHVSENKARYLLKNEENISKMTTAGQEKDMPLDKDALVGVPVSLRFSNDKYQAGLESGKANSAQTDALQTLCRNAMDHDFRIYTDTPRKIGDKWKVDPKFLTAIFYAEAIKGSFTIEFVDIKNVQGTPCAVLKWVFDMTGRQGTPANGEKPLNLKLKGEAICYRSLTDLIDLEVRVDSTIILDGHPNPYSRIMIEGPYSHHQKTTISKR